MYLDREGKVQTVHYRMPEDKKKSKGWGGAGEADEPVVVSKPRPDVTRNGIDMIGDLRTDALHEALSRAPIEDDTLMALLVLAFAGQNVRVDSGAGGDYRFGNRFGRHAATLFDTEGKLAFDMDTLRVATRNVLIEVLSCRENMSKSGIVSLVAGDVIGADGFLANMGTEDFLSCLSRPALEASCEGMSVLPRQRVKDTRAALVEHFKEGHFVHPSALFAPDATVLGKWLSDNSIGDEDDDENASVDQDGVGGEVIDARDSVEEGEDLAEGFREAAE
jgi:hypothetical protein